METLTIKDKKQEQFENFIKELNPNFAFYVNAIGCPIIEADELKIAKGFCIICENPKSYDSVGCVNDTRKMTEANFSYIAAGIRKSVTGENDLCSGQLNKSFFSNIEENADVVLVLYNIHGNGVGKTYRFAGFVCCNDLSIVGKHHADECDKIGGDPGGKTLYIDAICNGIDSMPDADPEIRNALKEQLETEGLESLRLQLKTLDPIYYKTVDLKNPNRIVHALEICSAKERTSIVRTIRKHNKNAAKVQEVIAFAISHGGIEYSEDKMLNFRDEELKLKN